MGFERQWTLTNLLLHSLHFLTSRLARVKFMAFYLCNDDDDDDYNCNYYYYCQAALQALKRKKRLEQQLIQIDGTLSTIEFQREALENANTNTEVLKNMSMAAKAIKGVHEKM